ncbi:MAG TPA: hypothetical protein VEK86_03430 [Gemmatimonadales bacterium]|nr:hypothetical protein [Gemmatimonadales bacterium]
MVEPKLTPNQLRRIDEIEQYQRTVEHVKKLVAELEANRAAKPTILNGICGTIARELSHMRQRALASNVGTLADMAGALAVVAGRGGTGLAMKIRALGDGVNSLTIQLDQALKAAHEPEKTDKKPS